MITLYTVRENSKGVIRTLEEINKPLLKRYKDNKMKLNPDKCHLLMSGKEYSNINVGNITKNSHNANLVGVFFDKHDSFGNHIQNMCIKASRTLQHYTWIYQKEISECFF